MEISLLRSLHTSTISLLQCSSSQGIKIKLARAYYWKIKELLKLLRPILEANADSGIDLDEKKQIAFAGLCQSLDELGEIFENWEPLMSKIYFVLQVENFIIEIQTNVIQVLEELRSLDCIFPAELTDFSVKQSIKEMKQLQRISPIISKAISDHSKGFRASPEILAKIVTELSLESNQELLIELMALKKIKENADLSEDADKASYTGQLIGLIAHLQGLLASFRLSQACDPIPIPSDFFCPLSLEPMTDPVIIESGQTYERAFIQKWFDLGLNVCPKTNQALSHTILIPNVVMKELISRWHDMKKNKMSADSTCSQPSVRISMVSTSQEHSLSFLTASPITTTAVSSAYDDQTLSLDYRGISHFYTSDSDSSEELETTEQQTPTKLVSSFGTREDLLEVEARLISYAESLNSDSVEAQRIATAVIRLLAKQGFENRIIIANCGVIPLLVRLLHSPDPSVQENSVTALLNLSINENNKAAIADSGAIEPIIHVLQKGTTEARENSAAALFNLSTTEGNRNKIGRSGAIEPLVDLLRNGTLRGKKDAANALFNLSISNENKVRIVQTTDAVKLLVELLDPMFGMVTVAVAILSNISTFYEGRMAIDQCGGIRELVEVLELGSEKGKENAAAALLLLCVNRSKCTNMILREGVIPPLVTLSQYGTPRARDKSKQLLDFLKRHRR